MEEDEIQAQGCKFPRVGNEEDILQDGGEVRTRRGGSDGGSTNRFHSWHHSSRIIRVSRASGGKDRHSKVMTSKGLRDRRVRLSVNTAIQFYDLQDRLGYDQPSKAVEWLIKSAADAIEELPSLNNTFPDTPKQPSDETRGVSEQGFIDSPDAELDHGENTNYLQNNQSQNLSLSKSACSSTSETSKGSGLSLSRSGIRVNRVKARERARERTAKEKEKEKENENESHHNIANANQQQQHQQHHNVNPISSFTELLTGGMNNAVSPRGSVHHENNAAAGCRQQQWCSSSAAAPMEYFTSGLLAPSSSRTHNHNQTSSGFSLSQIQVGHSHSLQDAMFNNGDPSVQFSSVSVASHPEVFTFRRIHCSFPHWSCSCFFRCSTFHGEPPPPPPPVFFCF
ncbi:hypothetical protein RJT34_03836 [Clitoria ternatea]|uniref:Transcription factor TCP2-like n=1 Tax=Clitoria ternatea TaxID=43366 RepID=A0AAN9KKI4_CLITE